ncbi:MAG: hypothetical protein KAT68_01995 [Bacteroidales bacterium]|nr:hypothetical protein [Bacteroidales bacterium]
MKDKYSISQLINYLLLSISLIGMFLFVFACEKNSENETNLTSQGELLNYNGCKTFEKNTETERNYTCVEYNYVNNKLELKHINAGFNCCLEEITANITISNDTITIKEIEKEALCNCLCLFDLDFKLENISAKEYYIKFIEPYVTGEMDKLEFLVNFSDSSSGSFCLERNNYPWGIY